MTRRISLLLSVAALSLTAACPALGSSASCDWPDAAGTDGWPAVEAVAFVLKLPPGYRDQTLPGLVARDGEWAEQWGAGDHVLEYDLNSSGSAASAVPPGGWRCEEELGGSGAVASILVVPPNSAVPGSRYGVEVVWPGGVSLRASGPGDDPQRFREAVAAVRTARFRTVFTAEDERRAEWEMCQRMRRSSDPAVRRHVAEWDAEECPSTPPPPVVYELVR